MQKRPNFGSKQIRSLKEIKPGMVVIDPSFNFTYKIVGEPYQDENGSWWVDVLWNLTHDKWLPEEMSLADHGVVPYHNGFWNQQKWLSRYL